MKGSEQDDAEDTVQIMVKVCPMKAADAFAPDISIAITCWRMDRELPRTLWSLSRTFQQGAEDLTWEIIVVDNGSDNLPIPPIMEPVPQILAARHPAPSPVGAINEALAMARGRIVGAWIDGARLASPYLLATVARAAKAHPAPVIAVPNRQFGLERQATSAHRGYDRATEDALLQTAGWPDPSADLFAVSWPEELSPTAPMLETNALFLHRDTWAALDGYDPAFTEPGGGMCNPDMLNRAVNHPGTQFIRLSGVATFHQIHGGTSTSDEAQAIRMVKEATRTYAALRGHPPRKQRARGWVFDAATGVIDRS